MTLIIGVEDPGNNRAIVCADSGAWRGDQIDVLRTPKIWRSNGWVAGLSGGWSQSLRVRNVALPDLEEPTREECEKALLGWSERILELLGKHNDASKRNGHDGYTGGALIAAYSRWVWYVSGGCVTNVERGYQAIGCEDYAIGALAMMRTLCWVDAEEMAKCAMQAVETISTAIHRPFRWMTTDGKEGTW